MNTMKDRRVILVPYGMYKRYKKEIRSGTVSSSVLSEIDQITNSLIQDLFTIGTELVTLNHITNTKSPKTRTSDGDSRTIAQVMTAATASPSDDAVTFDENSDGDIYVILHASLFSHDIPPNILLRIVGDKLSNMSAYLVSTVLGTQYVKYLHSVADLQSSETKH